MQGWDLQYTALHHAVVNRMPEMVRTLMQLGADPQNGIYPITEATTPLTLARERGYDDIAAIIREEAARREHGRPSRADLPEELIAALRAGDEDKALELLEQRPELASARVDRDRHSLLHLASALLLPRVAAWLLAHGANPNEPAADGATALDLTGHFRPHARKLEEAPALAELLRAGGAELTPRAAVILGDEQFLRARHTTASLVEPQDDQGWLLRLAVDFDRLAILQLLLDLGLDPDARFRVDSPDETAYTWGMPLYACVRQGKHEMAELLLDRGADPNAQVYASGTPLSEAFGQRDEKMIALLVRFGGKPNASMAGLYRRKDLAMRLLAEHGDTPLPDDGFSSGPVAEQLIGAAARGGDPEILALALERIDWPAGDPRWYGPLISPLGFWNHWIGPWCHLEWDRGGYLACFRMILARLGPPTRQHRFGMTILHAIVTMGGHVAPEERAAFAAAALDAGAPLRVRDNFLRSTPLGWACRWGRAELVKVFLAGGAEPFEDDAEPWATPLAWAGNMNHPEILALLRAHS